MHKLLLGSLHNQIPSEDVKKASHIPCCNRHEPYTQAKKGTQDTGYSDTVTHPSTIPARPGLTSVISEWRITDGIL